MGNAEPVGPPDLKGLVHAKHSVKVFLDANVLIPEYLRAVFFDLADARELSVHWSDQVLMETRRNLVKPGGHYELAPDTVDKLLRTFAHAFPDALVEGYEHLEARFEGKTDSKDEHVAAGALQLSQLVGQPIVLVTNNARDLPQWAFEGTRVLMVRPGRFLTALLAARPQVAHVLDSLCRRLRRPAVSQEDLLTVMAKSGCLEFAVALGKAWGFDLGAAPARK